MSSEGQLHHNRETWRAPQGAGVGQGQPLSVDFLLTPGVHSSGTLVQGPGEQGLHAEAQCSKQGWLRRPAARSVADVHQVHAGAFKDLVRLRGRSAQRLEAEFDGLVAEVGD